VFFWSYRALTPAAARLFRLLGLHRGPDIGLAAAASLAGTPVGQVRTPLAELCRAHLVAQPGRDRFTLHDLLRAYAAEQAAAVDSAPERRAATHRVLDHYLHAAHAAALLLNRHRDPISPAPVQPGVTLETVTDQHSAMSWFTAEHAVLVGAVRHSAATGFDTHTWQLAWTLLTYFDRRGHWHDLVAVQEAAVEAARRLADRAAEAGAHRLLSAAYRRLDRPDDARVELERALELFQSLPSHSGHGRTHLGLAEMYEREGRYREAVFHTERGLRLFETLGDGVGQADALNMAGWLHTLLGEYEAARTACQRALALFQDAGSRRGEAITWDSLGFIHHRLGRYAKAVDCYQRAVTGVRETGNRYGEADALAHLGDAHHDNGDHDAAHACWRQALDILTELDHPHADAVRARLDRPGQPPAS
jgi:tetratricopeptide (TPR) repeat protein